MPLIETWIKAWLYLGFMIGWSRTARPQFDISTDMGLVLVPADAEVDSAIFRLRATDQDADFPLIFDISATATPIVRVENLPCTLYNKVCQANVILVRRLMPGRLHDFVVRVIDSKGDYNSMQATISVTNATTPRDRIFPHIPSLIVVPEDAKPGTELDYILVQSNPWSGKPVYIELWQPKELFKIRQRQTKAQTRGVITLIGELDFETQSMYTLMIYATDPFTERGKDTRNIAGLQVVVIIQDVQDVAPIFTLAPPLTKINNTVQPGDVVLRVHAEDGDKGIPRQVTYGLLPENNPFVSFFNISEATGEIILTRPLKELTQITYVGAPVVLKVVAEEIRRLREEPPAQSTVVEVGFLLGEPGNNPPHFENDNYMAWLDENAEPGKVVMFSDPYLTKVKDEDVGKAGVFALKLANNNGTFEVSPAVGERSVDFIITVRDNTLIDYEMHQSLNFKIIAQEVGPPSNLSATVPVTILLRDVNDNSPIFDAEYYEVELSENATTGTKVVQVHATDKDSGLYGMILYTHITGPGSDAFTMDPNTGVISVAMGNKLDREQTSQLRLSVEARDTNGKGLRGVVPLVVNLLDVNDNAPIFDKPIYELTLNAEFTNFTMPVFLKASDADAEAPNNIVQYEIIHGNYESKFYLNDVTGELVLREPVNKTRYIRENSHPEDKKQKVFRNEDGNVNLSENSTEININFEAKTTEGYQTRNTLGTKSRDVRTKRAEEKALFTLTARAYDLGVPHLSSLTQIRVLRGVVIGARIVLFVMPGEHPDPAKTADTLATITGGRVIIQEIRPYDSQPSDSEGGKKSVIVARVEQKGSETLVDIEKIKDILAANGVGVISGMDPTDRIPSEVADDTKTVTNNSVTINNQEVTVYKAEKNLLTWILIFLGILMLLAIICLIICCICPVCPFYMEPRKRRIHSNETLLYRADARPKRHLRRKRTNLDGAITDTAKKQAWSADPMKRNWKFNRRNTKQYGIASLPGDIIREAEIQIEPKRNALSLGLRESPVAVHRIRDFIRRSDDDRIYIEDVEAHARNYDAVDIDSIRRYEIARGSDISRQRHLAQQLANQNTGVREQHFFREGNAEVLRLVTRGQAEERNQGHHPVTVLIDQQPHLYKNGKDILLQRFIDDQKIQQDLRGNGHDIEDVSMESHQHLKEVSPRKQEILLIPQSLDLDHRYQYDQMGPDFQKLVIDRGNFEKARRADMNDNAKREIQGLREGGGEAMASDPTSKSAENSTDEARDQTQPDVQAYAINEVELVRQNALLTRLLLETGNNRGLGGILLDTGSYLETQSLPGQVATATQTDRTTATQTDRLARSRSDNDESDDDNRLKKKIKVKKRSDVIQPKLIKTIWVKSTIPEEVHQKDFDDSSSAIRKKFNVPKEVRRASVSPEVLQEISDSLDENANGNSLRDEDEEEGSLRIHQTVKEKSKIYESKTEDSTSPETDKNRAVKGKIKKAREKTGFAINVARKKVEPSFRILEKEITSLQKKIRSFSERKSKTVVEEQEEENSSVDHSKKFEKKFIKLKEQNKELKQDINEIQDESKAGQKDVYLFQTQKLDGAKLKRKPLKQQHALQTMNTGIVDQKNVLEIEKMPLKINKDQLSTKKSSSHIKLKRQSRLQISKGTVKSIISRTKEAARRKVEEFKKEEDSSEEKRPMKSAETNEKTTLEKKITESSKISSKDGLDAQGKAYTIISTKVGTLPSMIVSDSEKQNKTEVDKRKHKSGKDIVVTNEENTTLISERTVTSKQSKELENKGSVSVNEKSNILLQKTFANYENIKIPLDKESSIPGDDKKPSADQVLSATTDKEEEFFSAQDSNTTTDKDRKPYVQQQTSIYEERKPTVSSKFTTSDGVCLTLSEQKNIEIDKSKIPLNDQHVETHESSSEMNKLILETGDMTFIDNFQEPTEETRKKTHSIAKNLSDLAQIQQDDYNSNEKNADLQFEKEEKNGSLLEEEKTKDAEFQNSDTMAKEEMKIRKSAEIRDKTMSSEDNSGSFTLTNNEEILKEGEEFPYRNLPESYTSVKSSVGHQVEKEEHVTESKTLEDSIKDSESELKSIKENTNMEGKEGKDDVKIEEKDKRKEGIGKENESNVHEEKKEDILDHKIINSQNKSILSSTSRSAAEHANSQELNQLLKESVQTRSTDGSESADQVIQTADLKNSVQVKQSNKILDEGMSETATRTSVFKPLTPESKSEVLKPSSTFQSSQKSSFKSIDSKDQKTTEDSTTRKLFSSAGIEFRMEDSDRKMAKMLAEEQERLRRLELFYKHYNESDDESDSSVDSDMSSKTMLKSQPYKTSRISSPTKQIPAKDGDFALSEGKNDIRNTKTDENTQNLRNSSEKSSLRTDSPKDKDVKQKSGEAPDISNKDTTEMEPESKLQKDNQKTRPVIVDVMKKQNLKGTSTPQKTSGRNETLQRSLKSASDPKSSPQKEIRKAHLSDNESMVRSKSSRCKSILVSDAESKSQEDSKKIMGFRKQTNKSHLSKNDAKKQLKTQDKPSVVLSVKKVKEELTKESDAKGLDVHKIVSTIDGEKPYALDESASTNIIEKHLRKSSPKEVSKSVKNEEMLSHTEDRTLDQSQNLISKETGQLTKQTSEHDEVNHSEKSPKKEERKSLNDEKKNHRRRRDQYSLVSEKELQPKSEAGHEDNHPEHHRQLHITKSKIDRDIKSDLEKEEVIKAQSKYMSWYKQKREEMEKKRLERKLAEEEEQRPRWMKKSKSTNCKPKNVSGKIAELKSHGTSKTKHKVKPSVNLESEQLKAIVRQGRKMRKAEGHKEDLTVQIFAPKKPPTVQQNIIQPTPKHPLIQHSEYKYEKMPTPFYLHPPPVPHPSPQLSPEHCPDQEKRKLDDDLDSGIAVSMQGSTRLRHQQLLEKKSVFDIAYNEAAPSQLRSDSSTPPS